MCAKYCLYSLVKAEACTIFMWKGEGFSTRNKEVIDRLYEHVTPWKCAFQNLPPWLVQQKIGEYGDDGSAVHQQIRGGNNSLVKYDTEVEYELAHSEGRSRIRNPPSDAKRSYQERQNFSTNIMPKRVQTCTRWRGSRIRHPLLSVIRKTHAGLKWIFIAK